MIDAFLKKITDREAVIGVVGLGYVGLPLLIEFSKAGFKVVGFDIDETKISKLKDGISYIKHISQPDIQNMSNSGKFEAYTDFSYSSECDAILICVPTPLTKHREPDMSYIKDTGKFLQPYVRKGQLFSLESTTYPGTTDEVLKPILEENGLVAGKDFYLSFSPEREDPCNPKYSTSTIPKVVGGYNEDSLKVAAALYDTVICEIVPVSSTATAEATKLMENIFRSVNIALVNELKVVFDNMGINVWEVINAAKTKPFGFMPFYPGPGLGGHCIPIDPFYLTWKAYEFESPTRFIELAGEINTNMPKYVVHRTLEAFNDRKKVLNGGKILILGLAYKKNIDDMRESPSFKLMELLESKGAIVDYCDPYCPEIPNNRHYPEYAGKKTVENLNEKINDYDAILISTAHDCFDYEYICKHASLIIDSRNAVPDGANVVRA
jgi:UDP-N-acetyl-D-glucosamine dehydrogenase